MENTEPRRTIPKVLITVLVTAVLVIGILVVFRRAVFAWMVSKLPSYPALEITPVPLDTADVDGGVGDAVEADGYRFETPWAGLASEGDASTMWVRRLPDGRSVGLMGRENSVGLRAELLGSRASRTEAEYRAVLGEATLADNLSLLRAVMGVTVEDANALLDGRVGERAAILLALKTVVAVNGETGIFSFSFPGLSGFQLGDPAKARLVSVQAVDGDDSPVEIWFRATEDGPGFTQAEINRVLSTFGKVPPSPE